MENKENILNTDEKGRFHPWERPRNPLGKVFAGFIIVVAGILLLFRQMGYPIPEWIFTWPVLLIVTGLFIGIRHSFRRFGWIVPVIIGGLFLAENLIVDFSFRQYLWPIAIIILGLIIMLKPRRKNHHKRWQRKWEKYQAMYRGSYSPDDYLDSVTVFAGIKKNILSKDFRGGEVTNFFGGAEINLSQADIQGKIELEITEFFGGTKLIVPAHWELKSELVAFMGGIEDKRQLQHNLAVDPDKVLLLRGTTVMGGIQITSF